MRWEPLFLFFVFLAGWCIKTVQGASVTADKRDAGHQENINANTVKTTKGDVVELKGRKNRDVADTDQETNWNVPFLSKDDYGDADWHPSTSIQEIHPHLTPEAPIIGRDNDGDNLSQNWNQTTDNSSTQCGEYSSQLMPSGHCRLTATLPAVGTGQKPCPDMFRCTDDISFWLHENQNRKEQLKELRETMSELQEELRNHRHRLKVLEMQVGWIKPKKSMLFSEEKTFQILENFPHFHRKMYPSITFFCLCCFCETR